MKKTFCDACGKEIDFEGPGRKLFDPQHIVVKLSNGLTFTAAKAMTHKNSEVCNECLESFVDAINGYGEIAYAKIELINGSDRKVVIQA